MRNKNQKRLQNWANKRIKTMNQTIKKDNLWIGRFFAHQIYSKYDHFEDGSGGILFILLRFEDKKTKITKDKWFEIFCKNPFFGSDLFFTMNDFIIDTVKVWENENPYAEMRKRQGENNYVK